MPTYKKRSSKNIVSKGHLEGNHTKYKFGNKSKFVVQVFLSNSESCSRRIENFGNKESNCSDMYMTTTGNLKSISKRNSSKNILTLPDSTSNLVKLASNTAQLVFQLN